jgi:transposase
MFLMPPSVQDWLPKEHLARFVVEVVEQLDLRALRDSYAGCGSAAHHPEMLGALLFYGYATGIRASRQGSKRQRANRLRFFLSLLTRTPITMLSQIFESVSCPS